MYVWSIRWPLRIPHAFHHALHAWGPLAHVTKPYKSPEDLAECCSVAPVSQICVLWKTLRFWGRAIAWNRRGVLSSKHIHPKVLWLCVPGISLVLRVVLEVFKSGGPYSFPAPTLIPSWIVKGGWLTGAGVDACTKQVTFCQSWPICSGPVPSLVVPLFTMEENRFMSLPHPALTDWVSVVEREARSLLGLEWFYLSELRKNKTLAEAWTAVDLRKDLRGWHRCNLGGRGLCFLHTVSIFWCKNKIGIWVIVGLLSVVVVHKSSPCINRDQGGGRFEG